jgi:hypothetical protein
MSNKRISLNVPGRSLNRLGVSKKISLKLPKSYLKRKQSNTGSSIMFIIIILIVFICGLFGLYFLYNHYSNYSVTGKSEKVLINKIYDAKSSHTIPSGSLPPSSSGHEFNINFWMFINDYIYDYDIDKIIIDRGNTFIVQLDKETNSLTIKLLTLKRNYTEAHNSLNNIASKSSYSPVDFVSTTISPNSEELEVFKVNNIELQKWININISLVNTSLDIFIDGYLVKTLLLKGIPINGHYDMNICPSGGFNGFLNKLTYHNKALSPQEILSIYKTKP